MSLATWTFPFRTSIASTSRAEPGMDSETEDVARRPAPVVKMPVVKILAEIHQGALTSTRTLPEISESAAMANAWLTSSNGST